MNEQPQNAASVAFALLIVGTAGLLLNEYILGWGTVATVSFAVANVLGLLLLGATYFRGRKPQSS